MVFRRTTIIVAFMLLSAAVSFATSGVPDLYLSTATRTYSGPEVAVMFNLPNGGGIEFTSAQSVIGTIDATITLVLRDAIGYPIANYPYEDLWLESADGGLSSCVGGSIANFVTNVNGTTSWSRPLRSGGFSEALTVVMVSGSRLMSDAGLAISHNSPDINGDGVVNLSDLAHFSADFYGGLNPFRSDFYPDGVLNLSDVTRLAQALGVSCP